MSNHLVIAPLVLPLLVGILQVSLWRAPIALRRVLGLAAVAGQIGVALALTSAVSGGDVLVYALGDWPAPFGIVLVADRLAGWMLLITALLALFALGYACAGEDTRGAHFHALYQLQLFGLAGAFLTGDLFNLFVFFEVLLLASYGLLLHGGGRLRVKAGLHYVVVNLLGSTLFLIAAGLFYGLLGTLNFADLAVKAAAVPPEDVGLVRAAGLLLFAVFALKAALAPLYLWLPAAYAQASAPVAALFVIMTKVGAYSILRTQTLVFGAEAGPVADLITPWLMPFALGTLALGTVGALAANRLRQQVAYLVVASAGTLLTAFALPGGAGIAAGLYYLPHTTFAAAALVLTADIVARGRGETGDRLASARAVPRAALWGAVFLVAAVFVAGLPPLSGFLGKFLLLRAALDAPVWPWIWAVVLATALIGLIALARTGSVLFFRVLPDGEDAPPPPPAPAWFQVLPVFGLLGLGLALTLWAGPATGFARAIAGQLAHPGDYIAAVLRPHSGVAP